MIAVFPNDRMVTVYIASPYTKGDVGENVRKSFLFADKLLSLGFIPHPPLYTHFWHILSPKSYEEWMIIDQEWIRKCDCLFRMPGLSKGADQEVKYAMSLNKHVFFSVKELVDYYAKK